MKRLSNRLQALADQVIPGSIVVDVGTDHAYLPLYLVEHGICPRVIGIEINPGPLQSARNQVASAGLTHLILIREGNGLQAICPGEAQVVVIAGMGGKTICEILEAAPAVLAGIQRLILQPMGADKLVREWLVAHSWQIVQEDLVREDGVYYIIIIAEPSTLTVRWPENEALVYNAVKDELEDDTKDKMRNLMELEIGPDLINRHHPLLPEYLNYLLEREQRIYDHLKRSQNPEALLEQARRQERIEALQEIIQRQLS